MKKTTVVLGAALAALAITAPQAAAATPKAQASAACPSFRVLHNDRIGPAVLPAGNYAVIPKGLGLTCQSASKLFTRFLQNYDGNLGGGWVVVAQGKGKARFDRNGTPGFRVERNGSSGGGGGGNVPSTYGSVCPGQFEVLNDDVIGPLSFPKGGYRIVIPKGSIITCQNAAKLFKQFLNHPDGILPKNWRLKPTVALFFKPANPKGKKFRVDPAT
jgi:hypothetical protein